MNLSRSSTTSTNGGGWARGLNAALGVWLVISAYSWQHAASQMTNAWIVGILAVAIAGVAAFVSQGARWLNTALAVWLFISAFALPTVVAGTVWNNVIVSILMFAFSLVPGGTVASGGRSLRPAY